MNSRIIQMTTPKGFVSLFWTELKQARETDPNTTHEQVYEALETEYFKVVGIRRYSSFNSFRNCRDRR